jgi:hypothetical protein
MASSIYMVHPLFYTIKKCVSTSKTFNHVRLLEIHLSCFSGWILVILSSKIYVINFLKVSSRLAYMYSAVHIMHALQFFGFLQKYTGNNLQ